LAILSRETAIKGVSSPVGEWEVILVDLHRLYHGD